MNPVVLAEQEDRGDTIIEKLEQHIMTAKGAVVLYTPDDVGKGKDEVELTSRARQNVVLEHGWAIGHFGRSRIVIVNKDGVSEPGDLDGIVYVQANNSEWEKRLEREINIWDNPRKK